MTIYHDPNAYHSITIEYRNGPRGLDVRVRQESPGQEFDNDLTLRALQEARRHVEIQMEAKTRRPSGRCVETIDVGSNRIRCALYGEHTLHCARRKGKAIPFTKLTT